MIKEILDLNFTDIKDVFQPIFLQMTEQQRDEMINIFCGCDKTEDEIEDLIDSARSDAFDDGQEEGYEDGYHEGFSDGYNEGFEEGTKSE